MITVVLPPENAVDGIRAADEWTPVLRNSSVMPATDQGGNEEHAAKCSGPPCDGGPLAGQLIGERQDDKRDCQNSGRLG